MSPERQDRTAEMRGLFFDCSQELLQTLNEAALQMEKSPADLERMREVRRIVHTIKGDAAACGFKELSQLAHAMEDALETAPGSDGLPEVVFAAADTFTAMIAAYRERRSLPSGGALRRLMRKLTPHGSRSTHKNAPRTRKNSTTDTEPWTEYERRAIGDALDKGRKVLRISIKIDPSCGMPIAARQMVINELSQSGEVLAAYPDAGSSGQARSAEYAVASEVPPPQLTTRLRIPHLVSEATVAAVDPEQYRATAGDSASEAAASPSTTNFKAGDGILRVEGERIDAVLNLVGELVVGKSMLQQAVQAFRRLHPNDPLHGQFADAMSFQARVLSELQRAVMKVRMVPVEQLFRRFPRLVRDAALQCGCMAEMLASGEQTDLDKTILDAIAEPLTHLVRNAVSHGIESPEHRRAAGKPEKGTVRLNAYHRGNQVVIEVSDDGAGIPLDRIRRKAVQQGYASQAEIESMSDSDALQFIFRPGFSTAAEVTELSGRGIGLDIVQAVIARLKGTIEVDSRPGKGVTFRLKLPLTLAIIKALLFRAESRIYAIPLNSVIEIARAGEWEIHRVGQDEVLQVRGEVLRLLRLGSVRNQGETRAKLFVLVIHAQDDKLGLVVDELEGEEELVVKALDDQAIASEMVSGASILGDGRIALILNLTTLVERSLASSRPQMYGLLGAGSPPTISASAGSSK
jgi:two-component system chemotaxis sensor kinase CheA